MMVLGLGLVSLFDRFEGVDVNYVFGLVFLFNGFQWYCQVFKCLPC